MKKICTEIPEPLDIIVISIFCFMAVYGAWKILTDIFIWIAKKLDE